MPRVPEWLAERPGMLRTRFSVPAGRAWGRWAALAALAVFAFAGCSSKQDEDAVAVPQATPASGKAFFELKYRAASTAKPAAPNTAWSSDTADECYPNGVCAVQGIVNTPSWGFTLHCNGDNTCAGSTYRIVMPGLRSGVKLSFDPQPIGDGQTAWSTISVDPSVPAGLLTIKYATELATGPGSGFAIGRVNTLVLCGLSQNTCPKLDVRDTYMAGSPVVSGGAKHISVIGKEANFVAKGRGGVGSYRISNFSWDPSGWIYKPHQLDGTPPASLNYSDLHNPSLAIFWTSDGAQHVNATATLVRSDNQEISHPTTTVNYTVTEPEATIAILLHPNRISVGPRADAPGTWLRWGNVGKNAEAAGFRYHITKDHGFPGTISMTQIISGSIGYTPNVGPGFGQTMNLALDGPVNYRKPLSSKSTFGPAPFDAPAVGLKGTDTAVNVSEQFVAYFMYKPQTHGDWVTIKKGEWSWSAAATLVDAASNKWCLNGSTGCSGTAGSATTAGGGVVGSMDVPAWTTTFNANSSGGAKPGAPYTSIAAHP